MSLYIPCVFFFLVLEKIKIIFFFSFGCFLVYLVIERKKMTVGAGICVAERKLNVLGQSILSDVDENIIVTQPNGKAFTNGAFLGVNSDRIGSHRVFPIGKLQYVPSSSS